MRHSTIHLEKHGTARVDDAAFKAGVDEVLRLKPLQRVVRQMFGAAPSQRRSGSSSEVEVTSDRNPAKVRTRP